MGQLEIDSAKKHNARCTEQSAAARQPVLLKPPHLGGEGLAAAVKRPQHGTIDGRKIGRPAASVAGLNMRAPVDCGPTKLGQIDLLAVDATHGIARFNQKLHEILPSLIGGAGRFVTHSPTNACHESICLGSPGTGIGAVWC